LLILHADGVLSTTGKFNCRRSLHRVLFYGDHTAAVERFSRLNGVQMLREV